MFATYQNQSLVCSMTERGKYIVFEGIDGSGKSTQAERLVKRLGDTAVGVREPGGTPIASHIRALLLNQDLVREARTNLYLFTAARVELLESTVAPNLKRGLHVISDRAWPSTYAYQAAGEGVPEEEILEVTRLATGELFKPDFCILIDTPPKIALARTGLKDYFEKNDGDFYERVAEHYRQIVPTLGRHAIINGNQTPARVEAEVWEHLETIVG